MVRYLRISRGTRSWRLRYTFLICPVSLCRICCPTKISFVEIVIIELRRKKHCYIQVFKKLVMIYFCISFNSGEHFCEKSQHTDNRTVKRVSTFFHTHIHPSSLPPCPAPTPSPALPPCPAPTPKFPPRLRPRPTSVLINPSPCNFLGDRISGDWTPSPRDFIKMGVRFLLLPVLSGI